MNSLTTDRLHSLDALRGGALLLGVFFHAAFSFFPGDVFWLVKDTQSSASISALTFTLHIFRMTMFFLIAGYFGRMLSNRLGTAGFAKDRIKRIGLPLVIFWPLMIASFIGLAIWAMIVSNGGVMPENTPPQPPLTLATFPLTHLWFLYILLLLYAGALLLRTLISIIDRQNKLVGWCDIALKHFGWLPILPMLMALPIAFTFLNHPMWHPYFGIPTPEYGFVPNNVAILAYGGAFSLGWLLQRDRQLLIHVTRLWVPYMIVAILLSVYCLSLIGTTISYVPTLAGSEKTLYAFAYAFAIWCWTLGLIGLCLKIWSQESKVRRYIADASYWVYLIHLPVVMALQVFVSQWTLPAEVKYIIVLMVGLPIMFGTYEFLVRYTFLGRLLNGRKRKRMTHQIMEQPS